MSSKTHALLFLLSVASAARGDAPQSPAAGKAPFALPLVSQKGGWARYGATAETAGSEVTIRVLGSGSQNGKSGTWVGVEIQPPGMGLISTQLLVTGKRVTSESAAAIRVFVAGREQELPPGASVSVPMVESHGAADTETHEKITVKGRTLSTRHYVWTKQHFEVWVSDEVPGFGIVRMRGDSPMDLIDFGAAP